MFTVKLEDYLTNFSWDVERFDGDDPLPELSRRLQAIADKIDVDIRGFFSSYSEKKQTLAALARRQTYDSVLMRPLSLARLLHVLACVRVHVFCASAPVEV